VLVLVVGALGVVVWGVLSFELRRTRLAVQGG
jgi:hypothetical protein